MSSTKILFTSIWVERLPWNTAFPPGEKNAVGKVRLGATAAARLASGTPERSQGLPWCRAELPARQGPELAPCSPAALSGSPRGTQDPPEAQRSTNTLNRWSTQHAESLKTPGSIMHVSGCSIPFPCSFPSRNWIKGELCDCPLLSLGTQQRRQKSKGRFRLKKFPIQASAEAGLIPRLPAHNTRCVPTFTGSSRLDSRE